MYTTIGALEEYGAYVLYVASTQEEESLGLALRSASRLPTSAERREACRHLAGELDRLKLDGGSDLREAAQTTSYKELD